MTQIMRPNSDINSTWDTTGTTRYGVIDEETYDDSDYISVQGENLAIPPTQKCGLSTPLQTPSSGSATLRIRARVVFI